jgi:hypothetical protein
MPMRPRRDGGAFSQKDEDPLNKEDLLRTSTSTKLEQLNVDASTRTCPPSSKRDREERGERRRLVVVNAKGNGASSVSVKQSISPFWDTRVGTT